MAKTIWRPDAGRGDVQPGAGRGGEGEQRGKIPLRMAEASKDDNLEVIHEGAWYAAELSFRDGITFVHYEDFDNNEDDEWNAELVRSFQPIDAHIRVISTQLQDAECRILSVNQIVCALRRAEENEGWYDALITEVRRRPHKFADEGEVCTCLFTVVWQAGPGKDGVGRNLTCGDMCVLSDKDVATHPLMVEILRSARNEIMDKEQDEDEEMDEADEKDELECSVSKGKKRESDADEYTPSLEEMAEASREEQKSSSRCKKLKTRGTDVRQVKGEISAEPSLNAEFQRVCSSFPAERDKVAMGSASQPNFMRGSISRKANAPGEQNFLKECYTSPFVTSCKGPLQRDSSVKDQSSGTEVRVDVAKDVECKVRVKHENSDLNERQQSRAQVDPQPEIKPKPTDSTASASEVQLPKKVRITVDIVVDPGGSLSNSFAGAKVMPYPSAARSCKEELVDVKPHVRLGSAPKDAICLSDEEDAVNVKPLERIGSRDKDAICLSDEEQECAAAGSTETPSSCVNPLEDKNEGWNVRLQNSARDRSDFIKKVLKKCGCILLIDNLDVGVRPTDLLEILQMLCDDRKIQSVRIPPSYPQMNRAVGYVVFVDKESADAAAGVLNKVVIVSARGRPWVVHRQGQEGHVFRSASTLTGDVEDDNGGRSAGGYKILTRKQVSEYNLARKRQRVFEEHRKQTRVMSQRHAQEERKTSR